MLKRNLAIFTLAICGFMNLQAIEVFPSSNPIEVNQEETQPEQLACKKHKKHKHKELSSSNPSSPKMACGKRKKHKPVSSSEETLVDCKRCQDKRAAV